MTFFPEPLKPSEGRQDDPISVNPIEADRKSKDQKRDWESPEEKSHLPLFVAALIFMKKLVNAFTLNKGGSFEKYSQDELTNNVRSLKNFLDQLKEIDLSNDPKFFQQLSKIWHRILRDIQVANQTSQETYIDMDKLKGLIIDIEHFPPNEDHKLGYYLLEYIGERWLPVPFREILKYLYSDHKVNRETSVLEKWTNLIKDILES